MYVKKKEY